MDAARRRLLFGTAVGVLAAMPLSGLVGFALGWASLDAFPDDLLAHHRRALVAEPV